MSKDALGDRMKMYERVESDARFMPLLPIVARIDGRGFSKFTKGMDRPYDKRMSDAMIATTKRLVEETHALMGYTQSDEITLVWNQDDLRSQVWFDGRKQKMCTALAASATLYFYQEVLKTMPEYANRNPRFDARANNVPNKHEGAANLLWRERDATKNSVSMAARGYFSHAQILGKTGNEMKDMLMSKGINWNEYPASFKRGTFIQRRVLNCAFSAEELAELPPQHMALKDPSLVFQRNRVVTVDMPVFDKVTNRIEVVFEGAEPRTAETPVRKEYLGRIMEANFPYAQFQMDGFDDAIKHFNAREHRYGEYGIPVHQDNPELSRDENERIRFYRQSTIDEANVCCKIEIVERTETGLRLKVTPFGRYADDVEKALDSDSVIMAPRYMVRPASKDTDAREIGMFVAFDAVLK